MAYKDVVIADAPAQYWRFDRALDAEAGYRDAASTGYYEIRIAVPGTNAAPTRTANGGVDNSRALYVPLNQQLSFGSMANVGNDNQLAGGTWVWECWYKRASSSAILRYIANREGAASRTRIYQNASWQFVLETYDSSSVTRIITSPAFNDDDWHHIVVQRNATNVHELWVDGVLIGSHTTGTYNTSSAADVYLAGSKAGTGRGDLYMDEIVWYKTFLTPAKVQAHYAAGPKPAPKGYAWSLWNGTTEVPCTMEGVWNGTTVVPRVSEERVP